MTLINTLAEEIVQTVLNSYKYGLDSNSSGYQAQVNNKIKAKLEAAFRDYTNNLIKEATRLDDNDAFLAIKLGRSAYKAGITLTEEKE